MFKGQDFCEWQMPSNKWLHQNKKFTFFFSFSHVYKNDKFLLSFIALTVWSNSQGDLHLQFVNVNSNKYKP